jgi:hypothetical protein
MKKRQSPNRSLARRPTTPAPATSADRLLGDIRSLIEAGRQQLARTVNSGMVDLYWHIGKRIREDILHEQRAEYGEQIVSALSAELTAAYGRGYSRSNVFYLVQFGETFPDLEIVQSLPGQFLAKLCNVWKDMDLGSIMGSARRLVFTEKRIFTT